MSVKIKKTERGFALGEFKDQYGYKCSIQKSSLATDDCIWLGCDELELKQFMAGGGWKNVTPPTGEYVANTRMHLTRDMVKDLLPLLKKFVKTGELE